MNKRAWQVGFPVPLAVLGLYACGAVEGALPENAGGPRGASTGAHTEPLPEGAGKWSQLPSPPLSGRVGALVATVGDTIIVAGGWDFLCPPGADCVTPKSAPFADGAAYDVQTKRWKAIADAPAGFRGAGAAVVGQDVYTLSHCDPGPTCPVGRALLRYRSQADSWDKLQAPDEAGYYRLLALGDGVVAYRSSDEGGTTPDYRLIAGDDRWVALPDDPLPAGYDRFLVESEGRLLLFASLAGQETKLAAAYDRETGRWTELPASGKTGSQVWRAGSLLYLNPHFGNGGGGIFDPRANAWSPLPNLPHYDLAGIIAADRATYEYAAGWVLDTRTGDFLQIAPHTDGNRVYDQAISEGPALSLVVFGGQSWSGDAGQLRNDLWRWTPPGAPHSSE